MLDDMLDDAQEADMAILDGIDGDHDALNACEALILLDAQDADIEDTALALDANDAVMAYDADKE